MVTNMITFMTLFQFTSCNNSPLMFPKIINHHPNSHSDSCNIFTHIIHCGKEKSKAHRRNITESNLTTVCGFLKVIKIALFFTISTFKL